MEVKKQEEMQERLEKFYRETLQIKEDGLVQAAVPASKILTLRVGEILIREGTVPTNLCFLLKGVIRGVLPNHLHFLPVWGFRYAGQRLYATRIRDYGGAGRQ